MITELHGGLGHESGGEGKGGGGGGEERGRHIGLDKWTVKVPIWPSLWLFSSFLSFCSVHSASRSLYYLPFIPLLCSLTRLCVKGVWGGCGVKDQQSADPAFLWRGGEE